MGTWSAEPIGNDEAADFVMELEGRRRWGAVRSALARATRAGSSMDGDVASAAIAAAEVVAHGLGRPTRTDAYTEGIDQFVRRASGPGRRLVAQAARAVCLAAHPDGELAELWAESDADEWQEAIHRLVRSLDGALGGSTRSS